MGATVYVPWNGRGVKGGIVTICVESYQPRRALVIVEGCEEFPLPI